MSEKKNPLNPFDNDDLDEEVRAADDTGIVSGQQEIVEEEVEPHDGEPEP